MDERGKERNEEEEWYTPPANTSASFLNQREGVGLRGQEEWEGEDSSKASARRISQLYSLSPFTTTKAADDQKERFDDSDTSSEGDLGSNSRGRRRDRERRGKDKRSRERDSKSRSADREERCKQGRNREEKSSSEGEERQRAMEGRRSREVNGKERIDSEASSGASKRSPRTEEVPHRKLSCSSAGSEYSRKLDLPTQPSASKWSDNESRYAPISLDSHVLKHKPASRRSLDSGRYESGGREEKRERLEESRVGRRSDGGDYRPAMTMSRNGQGSAAATGGPQKEMPANLLDIFSQIAQFQKEKGVKPKK